MSTVPAPRFLVIEVPDLVAARRTFPALQARAEATGGTVLAAAMPRGVEVLEAGTRLSAVFIARWDDRGSLDAFWSGGGSEDFAPAASVAGSLAVSVRGVPFTGLPGDFLPTVATVEAPSLDSPPAYMLIQGSATGLEAIEKYVGIIMPMLRERRGYYVVYAESQDVQTLHGRWSEQAFIVSRWPTLEAARDFWWCERYQDIAIPVRTGHGAFTVLLMPGLAG